MGKVPTRKDLDNAERKMSHARLVLLDEIDRPQRDNQKDRQMVSELSNCIGQYMTIVRQLKKAQAFTLTITLRCWVTRTSASPLPLALSSAGGANSVY